MLYTAVLLLFRLYPSTFFHWCTNLILWIALWQCLACMSDLLSVDCQMPSRKQNVDSSGRMFTTVAAYQTYLKQAILWKLNLWNCRDLNLVGLNIWHLEMWSYCWASKSTASLNSVRRVQTFFPISHTQKQQKLISSTLSPLSQAEVSVRWIVAFFFSRWSLYSLVLPLKACFLIVLRQIWGG